MAKLNPDGCAIAVILLLFLFVAVAEAQISPPSFGNVTYVNKGSKVDLSWKYSFNNVIYVEWYFSNTNDEADYTPLATAVVGGKLTPQNTPLPNITFMPPSTLVLNNVTMDYNGTYKFVVYVVGVNPPPQSDIKVIILEKPMAVLNCSQSIVVTEGEDVYCLCDSKNGNPPPTASWSKDGKMIDGYGYLKKNLSLKNVSKEDSGIYKCIVQSHGLTDETYVLITMSSQPKAFTNCSYDQPIKINEGEAVACLCSSIDGNPPVIASWVKDKDGSIMNGMNNLRNILALEKIDRADGGTYRCKVESHGFLDQIPINIIVRYKPEISSFTTNMSCIIIGSSIAITCTAGGYPQPNLTLSYNGMVLRENVAKVNHIINPASYSSTGEYECLAINKLGTTMARIRLTTKHVQKPTRISTDTTTVNGSSADQLIGDNGTTEWYIIFITLLCGILIGMVISYIVGVLRRRMVKRKDNPIARDPRYAVPETQPEGARNIPVYQDLNLQDMKKEDNYQPLRKNARNASNNEAVNENEASYQELNKVRENGDENYQSLNRV